jgi:exodeoxyribonuclease III
VRIASNNINGINGRLETLLAWLPETQLDIVFLKEVKTPQTRSPDRQLAEAGYASVWHRQSRYIEAVVSGLLVGCLYAPNGNPAPGPK